MFVTFKLKSKFIDNALEIHYTSSTVMPLSLCVRNHIYTLTYTHKHRQLPGSLYIIELRSHSRAIPIKALCFCLCLETSPIFSLLPPLSVCTTTQTGRLPQLCNKCWVHSTPSKSQLYDIIALPPKVSWGSALSTVQKHIYLVARHSFFGIYLKLVKVNKSCLK